jgi:hypothetical protein
MTFDEKSFIEDSLDLIKKALEVSDVTVEYMKEDETSNDKPGKPFITFFV